MKKLDWKIGTVLLVGLLQMTACTKTGDVAGGDSLSLKSADDASLADPVGCKMRRIYQPYGSTPQTALFSYNSAGNPVNLIYSNNGTGSPNHYFYYDTQGRLKEWRKTYQGGSIVVEKHRYKYNASNVITQDTATYTEGDEVVFVHTLTYDSQGRIIKENIKNISSTSGFLEPTRNPTYTYDARGNLGVNGWASSKYDNKVSALRSVPLFMFLMRNYSKNNPAVQAKYNSKGLPLSLNPSNDDLFNSNVTTKIIYDCQ